MCRFCLLCGMSGLILSAQLAAQESTTIPAEPILVDGGRSIEQLIELALQHNPTIQQTIAEVSRARGTRWHVTRKPNPVVGYQASEVGNEGRAGQQGAYVSQVFVTANKLGLNDQAAGWDVEKLNWRWHRQQLQVRGAVSSRFYAVLGARQRLDVLRQLDEILAKGVTQTERWVDAGEIGTGQLLQARLERQQNRLAVENAVRDSEASERALAVAVGLPEIDLSQLSGSLETALPEIDFESQWHEIVQSHPDLESARANVVARQWEVQRQRVEPIPNLQTQLGVQYDASTGNTVTGIQVGVALPVHNKNLGQIAAANAEYIQACQDVQRRELALRDRYVEVIREYRTASQTIDNIHAELLPLARENLSTTSQLFDLGESSYVNLLTAQRTYVQIILGLVDARRAAWQAVALLQSKLLSDGLTIGD